MRGLKTIPAGQAWFWSTQWQAGEREPTGRPRPVTCHRATAARRTWSPTTTSAPRNACLPGHAAVRARKQLTPESRARFQRVITGQYVPDLARGVFPGRVAGQRRPGRGGRVCDDLGAGPPRHILLPAAAASRRTARDL